MIKTIEMLDKCVLTHLLIGLLIGVVLLFKEKKKCRWYICSCLLFFLLWRFYVKAETSRYFSLLVLPAIVLYCYSIKRILNRYKKIITTIIFITLTGQVIKAYNGDRNNYLLDLRDYIVEKNKDNKTILIDEKEKERLLGGITAYESFAVTSINAASAPKRIIHSYSYWQKPIMCIFKGYVQSDASFFDAHKYKCNAVFYTNIKNKKTISVYTREGHLFVEKNGASERSKQNNLIKNGDFEKTLVQPNIRKRFRNWVDSGLDYYDEETLVIPEHTILLSSWLVFEKSDFPQIHLDQQEPIEGDYSLAVHFTHSKYSLLYFLGRVPSKAGTLSFSIKVMHQNNPLILGKTQYDSNGVAIMAENPLTYYLAFVNSNIYNISIHIDQTEMLGNETLFFLRGKDTSILIDDIQFIPDQDN